MSDWTGPGRFDANGKMHLRKSLREKYTEMDTRDLIFNFGPIRNH